MQLYKLADGFQEAITALSQQHEAGMLDDVTLADTLEGMEGEVKDKMINVGLHIKNLSSNKVQLKTAMDDFQKRMRTTQKQIDFYTYYLVQNMLKTGIPKAGNEFIEIKYRKLPDIVDCVSAPPEYSLVVPATSKPDKVKIKEALLDGAVLPFATLVTDRKELSIK